MTESLLGFVRNFVFVTPVSIEENNDKKSYAAGKDLIQYRLSHRW
jgi:hypothetical protein